MPVLNGGPDLYSDTILNHSLNHIALKKQAAMTVNSQGKAPVHIPSYSHMPLNQRAYVPSGSTACL